MTARINSVAFAWALAEATVFFVVPDMLLTVVAQHRGLKTAVRAAAFAVLGAAAGGFAMWLAGAAWPETVRAGLDHVPAVSSQMIQRGAEDLAAEPFRAMLAGAFSGVPYKVFAGTAAGSGISAAQLLLFTLPARAARFLVSILAAVILDRVAASWLAAGPRATVLLGFWVVFYVIYFAVMPN